MGSIHEAVHEATGVHHAVKLIQGDLGADGGEALARFRREAHALARVDHPNVVRVHGAELEGPYPYLAQDLLTGGTLSERLEAGPLSVEEAVRAGKDFVTGAIANGLRLGRGIGPVDHGWRRR